MNRISWHRIATPFAFAALLTLAAPGLAHAADANKPSDKTAGPDAHHPDLSDKTSGGTAQPDAQAPSPMAAPDAAAGSDMMSGMMKRHMSMMGSDMMSGGMTGRCDNPAVVINILPGGQMSMGHMKSMGMMGEGMGEDGMGMMGMADMPGMMAAPGTTEAKVARMDMSADDVRNFVQSRLDKMPHGPAKIGDIAALDDNLFSVQLLNEVGEKVHRFVINRHTGEMMRAD